MDDEPEQLGPDLPEAWLEFIDQREWAAAERAAAYNDHYRKKAELDHKFGEPPHDRP